MVSADSLFGVFWGGNRANRRLCHARVKHDERKTYAVETH